MEVLKFGDWLLLIMIAAWLIVVIRKLCKNRREGGCIGCSGQCTRCQQHTTKNKI